MVLAVSVLGFGSMDCTMVACLPGARRCCARAEIVELFGSTRTAGSRSQETGRTSEPAKPRGRTRRVMTDMEDEDDRSGPAGPADFDDTFRRCYAPMVRSL